VELRGHSRLGQGSVEGFVDQGAEVLGNLHGVFGRHARLGSLNQRRGHGAHSEQTGDEEVAHLDVGYLLALGEKKHGKCK
jgi:hypothetical protein